MSRYLRGLMVLLFALTCVPLFAQAKPEYDPVAVVQRLSYDNFKNIKMITDSVREYMDTRQESFVGDIDELDRTVGVKVSLECPSNGVGDKYFVEGDYATGKVTVTCPHHAEESFKDHVLPESGTN